MFRFYSPAEAAALIPDGAVVGVNSFLGLCGADALHQGILDRFRESGHPRDLTLLTASGYGRWREDQLAETYVAEGAVSKVIASHFGSMPVTARRVMNNEIEGYCLPLGAITHGIRAGAGGLPGLISPVGLHLFVDPRQQGPGLNPRSQDKLVSLVELAGEEFLYYRLPRLDVAIIKATAVDGNGNLTFEDEFVMVDALTAAQNAKANGGIVLAQVDRVTFRYPRPRFVVVPGILVDGVVVREPEARPDTHASLSGDMHVPPAHMDYWMSRIAPGPAADTHQQQRHIIGRRAAEELVPGDVVNIGIGIPEMVGVYASRRNILREVTLTVEAGGIGGLPAPGHLFGATIGADFITDMASQFDFYNGGGLSICFMGGLEVDGRGNVNSHALPNQFAGIGGFANITYNTRRVVFCLTFTAGGLKVSQDEAGRVSIDQEGSLVKFHSPIHSISFSAENALARGQQVIYVTERCVFELVPEGLRLKEVYPGIDPQTQIKDLLDFELV